MVLHAFLSGYSDRKRIFLGWFCIQCYRFKSKETVLPFYLTYSGGGEATALGEIECNRQA